MPGVLLTNGFLRKTLAATRDLGRHGIGVTVADHSRPNPSAWSKYSTLSRRYPHPVHQKDAFITWLLDELSNTPYDMFVPMDDDTMDIAVQIQEHIRQRTHVLIPHQATYQTFRDKYKLTAAAQEFGFQVPQTVVATSADALDDYEGDFVWPVVLKPRLSSGSRGLRVAEGMDQLKSLYVEATAEYPLCMIQSYIPPGERTDVCLLLGREHELLGSFAQREVRHFPIPYGPSTVQESVLEEELVRNCYAFAKQLGWVGLIEFEFMTHPQTGVRYMLEANTRVWNSLHLAITAGVSFPFLQYEYLVNRRTVTARPYQIGVRCRNTLPTDTLHFLVNPGRWHMDPPFFSGKVRGGVDDILSWSDPLPTVGFVAALARYAFGKGALKAALKR